MALILRVQLCRGRSVWQLPRMDITLGRPATSPSPSTAHQLTTYSFRRLTTFAALPPGALGAALLLGLWINTAGAQQPSPPPQPQSQQQPHPTPQQLPPPPPPLQP